MDKTTSNVVKVPPRRIKVHYKGLHGFVEFHPSTRTWSYKLKLQTHIELEGDADSQQEATLKLKQQIEVAASGNNAKIRSID